jgi:putative hydrolase of the HAD superfamily
VKPPAPSLDLIVFDMDGVLAHLDHAKRLDTLAVLTGKRAAFIHQAIYASDFERDAEAGAYATGTEYLFEYNRRIASSLTREQWIAARRGAMTPIEETFAIARRLKRSVPLATLTNNGSLLKEAIAEILPAAAEVFGASFHASYEFGARKPDPLVFERLAAHYRVATQRVLLIDDQPEYIAGAHSAGLNTILFATPHELVLQLGTLLPSD